jgi:hypothetical protein
MMVLLPSTDPAGRLQDVYDTSLTAFNGLGRAVVNEYEDEYEYEYKRGRSTSFQPSAEKRKTVSSSTPLNG